MAGHELKSSQQVFNCQLDDLNLSMIAIVDYRGFRLIAQSRLPIAGDQTLVPFSTPALLSFVGLR